jgi:hypothetical protein
MKHIWNVNGAYFEWEMTVKVRPADNPPIRITEEVQSSALVHMKRIGELFQDVANLHEYRLEMDPVSRRDRG